MTDTVTVKLHVEGMPDYTYRAKRTLTPEIVRLTYRLGDLDPVNGIHPIYARIEGPAVDGPYDVDRQTEVIYRSHPQHWPTWLIALGAEHCPQRRG
ncbi:hypothetical protein [Streptomyces sp. NBC_01237]|uniref:hypothetical protein n=1 Tax=Streptomyces sp. NBC_01237 TaxID=2903790 RepID=UPI002DD7ED7A|nr:hypothetical protein [Streptomyces sp. NBC_01237]WRZ73911.1 hypothetical protein OG251_21015 [Streptomyces sp. NBC_01237]